jgi:hypothetical protein
MARDHLEELVACGRIILKLILSMLWTGFIWLKIIPLAGSCKYGNERPGPIEKENFLNS